MKSNTLLGHALTALLALGLSLPAQANTQAKRPDRPDQAQPAKQKPSIKLPEHANGQKALGFLKNSGKLPEFARFYGITEAQVEALFKNDPFAYLDTEGMLFFIEPANEESSNPEAQETVLPPGSGANQVSFPLSETFLLQSKPGLKKIIYLDFNGHVAQNTAWNRNVDVTTIINPPFDLDGDPNTFNDAELIAIQNVWKQVSEDFAAFDVNVTTRDFGREATLRSSTSDPEFGSHIVITRNDIQGTSKTICGRCGGIAYVGVFDDVGSDYYMPGYVFYNKLGSNTKNMAEAASHEIGHNVGLSHDGQLVYTFDANNNPIVKTNDYYRGHGSGETGWAPIMGVGYGKQLVQWSKGEYKNPTQTEDDYYQMQRNSVYFDADEYGDTPSKAQVLVPQTGSGFADFAVQGTIQGPNDVDYFKMSLGAGSLSIQGKPFHRSPNVDLLLTLLDSQGNALISANPTDKLAASLSFNIPSGGTYFVRVEGTGKGDPLGTGYTKYGSIGIYTLDIRGQLTPPSPPVAPNAVIGHSQLTGDAPLTVSFDASASTDENYDITDYSWNFGDGASASGSRVSHEFSNVGSFNVTLTVTDATGLSGTAKVTVVTSEPQQLPKLGVDSIQMDSVVDKPKGKRPPRYAAQGLVLITDANGQCIPNAQITVRWTGVVTSTSQATSSCETSGNTGKGNGKGNKGTAELSGAGTVFTSPKTDVPGTFTLTVTDVVLGGYQFAPGTSDQNSITVGQ